MRTPPAGRGQVMELDVGRDGRWRKGYIKLNSPATQVILPQMEKKKKKGLL